MEHLSSWPHYEEDEINAVKNILASGKVNYWTGEQGKFFEKEFADYIGVNHCVAVMNGTVALEAALYAIGIGAGDDVIVPSRTFIGTASAVVKMGAKPIIADVDPITQNITAKTAEAVLTVNTKAIIVVHLAGWSCDMQSLQTFAKKHNLKIIEDCAQATGAKFKGKHVGSFGDVAAFSFCQDKILSTGGEGGMVATNDRDIWQKIWSLKDHGKNYDAVYHQSHPTGFRWLVDSFGTNFRMTEMQASIGRIQLGKLNNWIALRRRNAAILTDSFSCIPALRVSLPDSDIDHAYYTYYAFVKSDKLKQDWNRDRIMQAINAENIPCIVGSCGEIYLEQAFQKAQLHPAARLPVARELSETSLMFQVHPRLAIEEMNTVVTVVEKVFAKAIK